MRRISAWGNYPIIEAEAGGFDTVKQLREKLTESSGPIIAYGNGRSYGDAPLQKHILLTRRFNKFLSFNEETGELRCQAGVLLSEILEVFVPRGWFLPVTPGTRHITVGGAIAADVHGKNHHVEGSFGEHILSMDVMRNDGSIVTCSPAGNSEFFHLTIGGMGLTGVILNTTFRLKKIETAYIRQETIRALHLDEIMDLFEQSSDWTYSVAWIDCLSSGEKMGRSVMMRGEHARVEELLTPRQNHAPLTPRPPRRMDVPFTFPNFALNKWTAQAFNALYYHKSPSVPDLRIVDYNHFFYPLDAIENWNRIYGKRGFTQYQFVIPKEAGREAMHQILDRIVQSGQGSFLAVLKLFGKQSGFMSFPMPGYTLALDFPISPKALGLFKELDAMVADYGGRVYLAKDARLDAEMFERMYPNAREFRQALSMLREDDSPHFASLLSSRIGVTP